jgi:rhodanese-related sulfurtransferase
VSADSAFAPADKPYEIDLSTAVGLYMKRKKSNVHFVDARTPDLYTAGHISGAINVPIEELGKYEATFRALPKEDLIVIYCDGGDCHLSHELAEWALQEGWNRLAVYKGGWDEWSVETEFIETGEASEKAQ